jgi:hypothetical protein
MQVARVGVFRPWERGARGKFRARGVLGCGLHLWGVSLTGDGSPAASLPGFPEEWMPKEMGRRGGGGMVRAEAGASGYSADSILTAVNASAAMPLVP